MDGRKININFPLADSPENYLFDLTGTTAQGIFANIKYFLSSKKGKRLYHPNFGLDLDKYLFEHFSQDMMKDLKSEISENILKYFPTASLNGIDARVTDEGRLLSIIIDCSIEGVIFKEELILN
jgi:phage baseplate assembly protein W